MNYLSRAIVPMSEALAAHCVDNYAWHQAIWKAFPNRPDDHRHFLFRVDTVETSLRVYLLSESEPMATPWLSWQTKRIEPTFLDHSSYRFQLKANPTMRRSVDKKRLGIHSEPSLIEWMSRKAESNGFRLNSENLSIGAPIAETFNRNGTQGKHVCVDFQGTLDVIDRDRFRNAFTIGIGSAKSFGYGLLMLQPIH